MWLILKWYAIQEDFFLLDSVRYRDDVMTTLKSDWFNLKTLMSDWYRKLTLSCVSFTIYQQSHSDIEGDVTPVSLQYQNVHWGISAYASVAQGSEYAWIWLNNILWQGFEYAFLTGTPRRIHVDSTSISRRNVDDQILTNFHVISAYFFNVTLLIEKSTSFPRPFFDVILLVEKSMLFPRTFFDGISVVEKSTLFPRTSFDVVSIVEESILFSRAFFDVICPVEICNCFYLLFST